jgi:pimeloyl-ACP methyl ester carboxylesterase
MLHTRDAGNGSPILFLHGWGCHGGFFDRQIKELSRGHRVLAPDLPGHGRTGATAKPTIESAVDACITLIERRGLEHVLVVGWSMGALIAWRMLQRPAAERIGGLIVVDMTPKVLNTKEWRLGLRDGLDQVRSDRFAAHLQHDWERLPTKIASSLFADGSDPPRRLLDWTAAEIAHADPLPLVSMWRSLAATDVRHLLPRISTPILLLRGGRSRLYGQDVADWQMEQLRNARLLTLEGAGHAPHLEQPDAFSAAVKSFRRDL